MGSKLIYVTKKQVSKFIENQIDWRKISEAQLLKEVEDVLIDLNEYPNDNKNQIKFYTRVNETLKNN